jgi:hypothetical protein
MRRRSKLLVTLLVGFYLMFPPRSILSRERGTWELEVGAPVHQWVHMQSYDTAAGCEAGAPQYRKWLDEARGLGQAQREMLEGAVFWHMCVAADDPRLR